MDKDELVPSLADAIEFAIDRALQEDESREILLAFARLEEAYFWANYHKEKLFGKDDHLTLLRPGENPPTR